MPYRHYVNIIIIIIIIFILVANKINKANINHGCDQYDCYNSFVMIAIINNY